MIVESHQVIEEFIQNMKVTRIVQTGYLNVPLTNMLAEHGEVILITSATFNPFEDKKQVILTNDHYHKSAYTFKNKHGILDVCVFGHMEQLGDFRATLCAWVPVIRKNGLIVFLNSQQEDIQKVIKSYIEQIDADYFEITECADLTFIKVK